MKNIIILSLGIYYLLFFQNNSNAQVFSWQQKADYGGGETYDPFWFTINGKAYVGAGISLGGSPQTVIYKQDFWEFDPSSNVWTQKANFLGSGRYGARGFAINGIGYAGTGWTPAATSSFYKYDPSLNMWSPITSFLGSARYTATSFELAGKGYIGLGYAPCKNDFWSYDPITDSWAQVASFPGNSRQGASVFTIGMKAYVGLGACTGSLFNDFASYDPINNTWLPIASFPGGARNGAYSFSIDHYGFVGLGFDYASTGNPFDFFSDFWMYDQVADSWSLVPVNFPGKARVQGMYFTLNNKGYLGLGSDTTFYTHYLTDVWEFNFTPSAINELNHTPFYASSVFPNPASEFITLQLNGKQNLLARDVIEIQNTSGRIVYHHELLSPSEKTIIDVSNFSNGIHVITVKRNNTIVALNKLVVSTN